MFEGRDFLEHTIFWIDLVGEVLMIFATMQVESPQNHHLTKLKMCLRCVFGLNEKETPRCLAILF